MNVMPEHSDTPQPEKLLLDFTNFWKKVDKNGPIHPTKPELGNCWLWTGKIRPNGYGMAWNGATQKEMRAHRAAWFMEFGPTDLKLCHSCDRPACLRTSHLFEGTDKDNLADMTSKGRRFSKLSEQDVLDIDKLLDGGAGLLEVALIFDVSISAISHIKKGRNWKHLLPRVTPPN